MQDRIEKIINLAAPPSNVWQALADHVSFGAWFRADISGPFVVGAVLKGTTTSPDYACIPWEMVVKELVQQQLFAFEWRDVGSTEPATLVTFQLEEISTGTRLTVTESGFSALSEGRRLEIFRENTKGWEEQAKNLTVYVEA